MTASIILASSSQTRADMLARANVAFDRVPPRVDEDAIKAALAAESARPHDVADTLAETKARRVSDKHPGRLVLGADQVLDCGGRIFDKPRDLDEAAEQLRALRGRRHELLSAAVIYLDGEPQWRTVGHVRLYMRGFSDDYLRGYLDRQGPALLQSVGAYRLEDEGVRLFDRVEGDYFAVLGLPLLEILNFLTLRGVLQT